MIEPHSSATSYERSGVGCLERHPLEQTLDLGDRFFVAVRVCRSADGRDCEGLHLKHPDPHDVASPDSEYADILHGHRKERVLLDGTYFSFENHADFPEKTAGITVILWNANETIGDVAERYRALDMDGSTESTRTTIGGLDALQLDVLASPTPESFSSPCVGAILSTHPNVDSVMACTWSRIWVIDVDGLSVSVIGSAGRYGGHGLDPENVWQIEDFEAFLDDFLAHFRFCTAATPCD